MRYATEILVREDARHDRLVLLLEVLHDFDCVARLDEAGRAIELELPDDAYEWIVSGGLATVLEEFCDCSEWRPRFHERPAGVRARLPAPRHERARTPLPERHAR